MRRAWSRTSSAASGAHAAGAVSARSCSAAAGKATCMLSHVLQQPLYKRLVRKINVWKKKPRYFLGFSAHSVGVQSEGGSQQQKGDSKISYTLPLLKVTRAGAWSSKVHKARKYSEP